MKYLLLAIISLSFTADFLFANLLYRDIYLEGPQLTLCKAWQQVEERSPYKVDLKLRDPKQAKFPIHGLVRLNRLIEVTKNYYSNFYKGGVDADVRGNRISFYLKKSPSSPGMQLLDLGTPKTPAQPVKKHTKKESPKPLKFELVPPDKPISQPKAPVFRKARPFVRNPMDNLDFPRMRSSGLLAVFYNPSFSLRRSMRNDMGLISDTAYIVEEFQENTNQYQVLIDGALLRQNLTAYYKRDKYHFALELIAGIHNSDIGLSKLMGGAFGSALNKGDIGFDFSDIVVSGGYKHDLERLKLIFELAGKISVGSERDLLTTGGQDYAASIEALFTLYKLDAAIRADFVMPGEVEFFNPAIGNTEVEDYMALHIGVGSRPEAWRGLGWSFALHDAGNPYRNLDTLKVFEERLRSASMLLDWPLSDNKSISIDFSVGLSESSPDAAIGFQFKF